MSSIGPEILMADAARAEVAKLREAIADAGFSVMQTSGKWSIHDVSEKGKAAEAEMLRVSILAIDTELQNRALKRQVVELEAEKERLRIRLLSAAGDDLCRLSQEEIKAYSSGAVKIPPREEFIPSCERFHEQIASTSGVLTNCLTLAQLIAENAKLEAETGALRDCLHAAQIYMGTISKSFLNTTLEQQEAWRQQCDAEWKAYLELKKKIETPRCEVRHE